MTPIVAAREILEGDGDSVSILGSRDWYKERATVLAMFVLTCGLRPMSEAPLDGRRVILKTAAGSYVSAAYTQSAVSGKMRWYDDADYGHDNPVGWIPEPRQLVEEVRHDRCRN